MVGIKDIAKIVGVSPATVSLALNDSPLVNEQTKKRICEAAKKLDYRPNPYARTLVTKRSGMLGLVVPDIRNIYYATLVHYINHAVRAAGYGMTIAMSENNPVYEEKIVTEMIDNRVDGLILCPLNTMFHPHAYLNKLTMPTIFAVSRYEDIDFPSVMPDYEQAMAKITRYAVGSGRKNIRYISGPRGEFSMELRKQGFLSVIKDESAVMHRIAVSYTEGIAAANELITSGDIQNVDCILCVNDILAAGVENALQRAGIRIPQDIAIGGFDDIIFAETTAVPLSTVRQDIKTIAETSVNLLLRKIDGAEISQLTTIPAQMILRDSL